MADAAGLGSSGTQRPSARRPRWTLIAPVALAAVLAAYVIRRQVIGLRFPVPWPDEGSFLWQALAFRDGFSLFASEVNPEREALWMPPGFMVLEGLVFKVVPFSLGAARTLSALFVCGAVSAVYAGLRRFEAKLVYPLLAGLFLFCRITQVAGNVARMEALELFVVSLGFLLLERGRAAALGVLLFAPLTHPNGLFALAFGVAYYLSRRDERRAFARSDALVLGMALSSWGLYGVHIARNWRSFTMDMEAQLRFKQLVSSDGGGPLGRALEPVVWVPALSLGAALVLSRRAGRRPGALGVLAAALLVQTVVTAGWLYEVYAAFAVLVASAYAVDAFLPSGPLFAEARRPRSAVLAASLLALVAFDARVFRRNAFLERSLERATVSRPNLAPAYLTDEDRAAMTRFLSSVVPGDDEPELSVQFLPDAEALIYEKLRGPKLRYVQQTFYEHRYDLLLVHDSVWFPPFVRDLELLKLVYPKPGHVDTTVVRARDGTEKWILYRWRNEAERKEAEP